LAASAAMTAAMRRLHTPLPKRERYPLPPREIVERLVGDGEEAALRDATMAAHFGYGAATRAIYALVAQKPGLLSGGLFGATVWRAS
jgi:hypothetical protein